ncbi:MAG: DUF899 family protein [Solirubrobacteraceae bacterium]
MSDDDEISNRSRFAEETNVSFPGESAEYRAARDRLLEREAELRHAIEAVAAARRELPRGGRFPRTSSSRGPRPDRSPISAGNSGNPRDADAADLGQRA